MKKLLLAFLLTIVGSSVLHAEGCTQEQKAEMIKQNLSQDVIDSACHKEKIPIKNRFYIGLGLTSGSGNYNVTIDDWFYSYSGSASYDSSSTPFKVGFILDNSNRLEFSYESMKHKFGGGTDTVSGWNIDYNFVYPQDSSFSPYWTIGFGSYEYEGTGAYIVGGENLSGAALNYGAGALYKIDDILEFEASFRGKAIIWQDLMSGTAIRSSDSTGTALYLGINLRF